MAELKGQVRKAKKAGQKPKTKNSGKHRYFKSVTPDERTILTGGPWILGYGWSDAPLGGTVTLQVSIANNGSVNPGSLYVQVWVGGSGVVDLTVGVPVVWSIDTRFPRLMQPGFPGAGLNPGTERDFLFALEVPATVQQTHYLLNVCLLRGVGTDWRVLDHVIAVFEVT